MFCVSLSVHELASGSGSRAGPSEKSWAAVSADEIGNDIAPLGFGPNGF